MGSSTGDLRLCVLGPTQVERSGRTVSIGGRLPRRLLTVLAAADGVPVGVDRLVEAMWSGRGPARASSSVHAYVSRLRHVLDAGDPRPSALVYADRHYRLVLPPGSRDVDEVDRLLRSAERAAPAETLRLTELALGLRRGEPFADAGLDAADLVAPVRVHWEERLQDAVERRLAALIDLGRTDQAVAELRRQIRVQPLREYGWQLLILGLYRCGRQAEALSACRELRRLLDSELGIRPGPAIRGLETSILQQDPRLLWERPSHVGGGSWRSSSEVPRPRDRFVGRRADLRRLDELSTSHRLITVHGPGGVGKTRLVLEWAEQQTDRTIWSVSLKSDGAATPAASTLARAIGVQNHAEDPMRAATRALADQHGIVILDNCEHVITSVRELVEKLLTACPGIVVVCTSRAPVDRPDEVVLSLASLSTGNESAAAVQLLVDRIAVHRPGWTPTPADRHQLLRLARRLDGLPLALELVAARGRAQSLAELLGSVEDLPRLDSAVDWSISLLTSAQRDLLLRLWPFVGGFTADAVDDALEVDSLPLLADLVARSVVVADTDANPTRYWLLEVVRSRCRRLDPDPDASQLALARWVRRFAWETDAQMCDRRSAAATRRLNADIPTIDAAIAYDLRHSPGDALRTVTELNCWWLRTGQGITLLRWLDAALAAAPDAGTGLLAKAHLLRGIALALTGQESLVSAQCEVVADLLERVPVDDPDHDHVEGELPYLRSLTAALTGDLSAGRRYAEECAVLTERLGITWLHATAQTTLAGHALAGGDVDSAYRRLAIALRESYQLGMRWGLATAGRVLAISYLVAGRAAEALSSAQAALQHARDDQDVTTSTSCCVVVARSLAVLGEPWAAALLLDGVRGWAARAAVRWDAAETGTLGDLDTVLAQTLSPEQRRTATQSAAQLELTELLALAGSSSAMAIPHWGPDDVRVPPSLSRRVSVESRPTGR